MKSTFLLTSLLFASCITQENINNQPTATCHAETAKPRDTHENMNALLWMQTSTEYHILCAKAYKNAEMALDAALTSPSASAAPEQISAKAIWEKANPDKNDAAFFKIANTDESLPPAIILDIDETVLDNSPAAAEAIKKRGTFNEEDWNQWVKRGEAKALPGVEKFLQHAMDKNVAIFYITNRTVDQENVTRKNLEQLKLPVRQGDDAILSKGEPRHSDSSDKSSRRAEIAKKHRILLLIGDDLGDFVSVSKLEPAARKMVAQQYAHLWSQSWVLLPNPTYGSWERCLYPKNLSDAATLELKSRKVEELIPK